MLLLWIVLGLAIAADPASSEAMPPATPTIAVSVTLPESVSIDPVARELVTSTRSDSIRFQIDGRPRIEGGMLTVKGVMENKGRRSSRVFIADVANAGGPFVLVPRGATHPVVVDSSARSPLEINLPAGAKVVFESGLVLKDWTWPEGGAEIDWRFDFWTEPMSGTLPGRLSPP